MGAGASSASGSGSGSESFGDSLWSGLERLRDELTKPLDGSDVSGNAEAEVVRLRGLLHDTGVIAGLGTGKVDMLEEENARLHHTSLYQGGALFVRRGQHFTLAVSRRSQRRRSIYE